MSLFPVSSCTDFSLYSRDLRDPVEILRSQYKEKYRSYMSTVMELEKKHFEEIFSTEDTDVDNDATVAPKRLSLAEYELDEDTKKENVRPEGQFSSSHRELPTVDLSRHYIKV